MQEVSVEVEAELLSAAHTNVLLLQQVFAQAQRWHLDLDADLAELENRCAMRNNNAASFYTFQKDFSAAVCQIFLEKGKG